MQRIRGKLTYSNVMVTILAVVVIGGGTAYAQTVGLPPNSVGQSALKNDSVGLGEIQSDAVGPQQLQDESVNAGKIKDGSVTPAKLSPQVKGELKGQKGATGATGAQGPAGAPGAAGTTARLETEVVNQATATNTTSQKELTVHCPSGAVLGGGYVLHSETAPGATKLRAIRSYPVDADSWRVRAVDDGPETEPSWELTVSVVCEK
jgi:hypothetical protein